MEAAARAFQTALAAFPEEADANVMDTLMQFVKQLEQTYGEEYDIVTFIYALRCFFCWPPAEELLRDPATATAIEAAWVEQNDAAYMGWLSSMNDDLRPLKWAKWTFQAKMSILREFMETAGAAAATRSQQSQAGAAEQQQLPPAAGNPPQ
jgi:hypothetical protein